MAELSGDAGRAAYEPAVADDACRQSGAEYDDEQVVHAGAEPELSLRQAGGPRIVLEGDGEVHGIGDRCREGRVAQAEVGGVADDPGVGADQPGSAEADGPDAGADEGGGHVHDRGEDGVWPFRGVVWAAAGFPQRSRGRCNGLP